MSQPIDRQSWQRISPILDAALKRPASERTAYLDEACAGDAELRRHVEELLAADAAAGSFLAKDAVERAAPLVAAIGEGSSLRPAPARRTHRRRLSPAAASSGEGGMGDGLPRRARGRAVRAAGRRQAAEAGARRRGCRGAVSCRSARSWPACSTRASPASSTAASRRKTAPYFVMEHVEGRPVTAYCDEQRLGVERAAAPLPRGLRRRPVRPPQPRRPPRPQAVEHPGGRGRAREAPRLRHRQAPGRGERGRGSGADAHRAARHDARVRGAGAGARRAGDDGHRRLRPRRPALRAAHG